jgi:hypothetical protein
LPGVVKDDTFMGKAVIDDMTARYINKSDA